MLRKDYRCPKCDGIRVGHIERVHGVARGEARAIGLRPPQTYMGLEVMSVTAVARTEAFVCTECGYFEEYVKEPEKVPWDEIEGFTWCRGEPPESGPYRT